jgi:ketosteroid isomerase-like protein
MNPLRPSSSRKCFEWYLLAGYLAVFLASAPAQGQTTQAVIEPDPLKAINLLRTELVDAFNKSDIDGLLSHLDPDVVVTWQNGEVCRGPQAVRAYYDRMLGGPNAVVAKLGIAPVVDDRHVYGDHAVSWGNLHDHYALKDGSEFSFDSRFTATIARRGEAWKVTSFHASVNAFDNPILKIAEKKVGMWSGIIGGLVGLVAGVVIARLFGRPKAKTQTPRTEG